MTNHAIPDVAMISGCFGTVLPSERWSKPVHLVEIARRLFSSREQDVSSRLTPLRKLRADVQPPKVGVVSARQLPEVRGCPDVTGKRFGIFWTKALS